MFVVKKIAFMLFILFSIVAVFAGNKYYQDKLDNQVKSARENLATQQQEEEQEKSNGPELEGPWSGRNWYSIGSSITADNKYQQIVQKELGFKTVQIDAELDQSIRTMADRVTSENLRDMDLITIFGETDDFAHSNILGTINDDKNTLSYYGELKMVTEKIIAAKEKDTVVVFITPMKRGEFNEEPSYTEPNANGSKLEEYVNAMKEVAGLYHIPVIDLYEKSAFHEETFAQLTVDNLHPNDQGYENISMVMIEGLKVIEPGTVTAIVPIIPAQRDEVTKEVEEGNKADTEEKAAAKNEKKPQNSVNKEKAEPRSKPKTETKPDVKPAPKPAPKPETKPEVKPAPKPAPNQRQNQHRHQHQTPTPKPAPVPDPEPTPAPELEDPTDEPVPIPEPEPTPEVEPEEPVVESAPMPESEVTPEPVV